VPFGAALDTVGLAGLADFARAANDQFVIVACDLKDTADCQVVREKVMQALAPDLRVRVGMATFPAEGADSETLLRNAEAALLRAKER